MISGISPNEFKDFFQKHEIFEKILKLWSAIVFLILILEQNVYGFICSTIWEEFRTLNKILKTSKNEIFEKNLKTLDCHSFLNFDFRTKCVWIYL